MSNAMYLIVEATLRVARGRATVGRPLVCFLGTWQFSLQRSGSKRLLAMFSDRMMRKHCNRRCIVANASDQFSMYMLLEVIAMDVARGCLELLEHCVVYAASCRIIDVYKASKHRRLTTATAKSELLPLIRE